MNVILENLLQNELLSDKDRFEIRQIFDVVSDDKKQNIINNFDKILIWIAIIKKELREQQEILLWKAIANIEKALKTARNNGIKKGTTSSIETLKQTI